MRVSKLYQGALTDGGAMTPTMTMITLDPLELACLTEVGMVATDDDQGDERIVVAWANDPDQLGSMMEDMIRGQIPHLESFEIDYTQEEGG